MKAESVIKIPGDTIKEMSYYLDLHPSIISNYYHGQIKARGVLQYCTITQNLKL